MQFSSGKTWTEVMEPPAGLTTEQAELMERENLLRQKFAAKVYDPELEDPRLGLHDVFDSYDSYGFAKETPEEKKVPKILSQYRRDLKEGQSTIVSEDSFRSRWEEFTQGLFNGFNWTNVFAAGGAPLGCLTHSPDEKPYQGSDIDLFIVGLDNDEDANQKLIEIYETVMKNTAARGMGTPQIIRTGRAVTILGEYPVRHLQIILRLHKSPAEVLAGFDIDSCTVGYDGHNVLAAERFRRAMTKGYNLLNPSRRSLNYEVRLRKYSKRGFCIAVPDLDKSRVDPALFSKQSTKVQGLAKLLIYEYLTLHPKPEWSFTRPSNSVLRKYRKHTDGLLNDQIDEYEELEAQNPSDYSLLFIPWGPKWYTSTLMSLFNYKDQAQLYSQQGSDTASKKGRFVAHRHMFTTGIDGVINGTSKLYWCKMCEKQEQEAETGDDDQGRFVKGRLSWVKDNAVLQDYDNGFKRQLFSGSFQTVLEEDFDKDVYVAGEKPVRSSALKVPDVDSLLFDVTAAVSGSFSCDVCSSTFASQNLLWRHRRNSGHSTKSIADATPSPTAGLKTFFEQAGPKTPTKNTTPFKSTSTPIYANVSDELNLSDFGPQPGGWKSSSSPLPSVHFEPQSPLATASATTTETSQTSPTSQNYSVPQPKKKFSNIGTIEPPSWWQSTDSPVPLPLEHLEAAARAPSDPTVKCFLLASLLHKKGMLDLEEKGMFKNLIIKQEAIVLAACQAFEIDNSFEELADTISRVCILKKSEAQ